MGVSEDVLHPPFKNKGSQLGHVQVFTVITYSSVISVTLHSCVGSPGVGVPLLRLSTGPSEPEPRRHNQHITDDLIPSGDHLLL